MNKYLFTGLFLILATLTFGQTTEDKQTVIQMTISLDELDPYLGADTGDGMKELIVMDEGVVPSDLELTKFGKPVRFMAPKDLFFHNITAFLDFEKFEISPRRAEIIYLYKNEGLTVDLTFEKAKTGWTVKTIKLTENNQ